MSPKVRRTLLVSAAVVVGLAAAGWFGLKAYLNSAGARSVAAGRLSEMVGLPVEVDSLSVGGQTSTLSFRVLDPDTAGGPSPPAEILRVESASADVSLADLLLSRVAPKELTIRGAVLHLRAARDGKLVTHLPKFPDSSSTGPIPRVRLDGVTVKIRQEGRPEFVLTGISGKLDPDGDKVTVTAAADDPQWGKWEGTGTADVKAATGSATLTTANVVLDADRFRSIPYVPPAIWDQVTPSGHTPVAVTLAVGPQREFSFLVDFAPTGNACLTIHAIETPFTHLAGRIRVHGPAVEVQDCRGRLADGTVHVNGNLDFGPEPSVLAFRVSADGLDVQKLPAAWHLPRDVEGKLKGRADLTVTLAADGSITTAGGGLAQVENARWRGLPVEEMSFRLHSDGKRFRFQQAGGVSTSPPAPPLRGEGSKWADNIDDGPRLPPARSPFPLREGGRGVRFRLPPVAHAPGSRAGTPARRTPCQAPAAKKPAAKKPDPEPTTIDANLALRDIDVAELLKKLNVGLPYRLAGKVSVKVSVTIPVETAGRLTAYKATGSVTSPEFRFEGLTVRDLAADLKFDKGVLTLTSLRGTFPDPARPAAPPGTLKGTATAAVEPRGDLTANLALTDIPLGEVLKAIPGVAPPVAGAVNGKGTFRAPIDKIRDATTWKASGTLTADDVTIGASEANRLSLGWAIDAGKLTVSDLAAGVFGGKVTASADVPFDEKQTGRFTLKFTDLNTTLLAKNVPNFPLKLTGNASGGIDGKLTPDPNGNGRTTTADVSLTAPRLTVQGIPAERLTGKLGVAPGAITYDLEGRSLGGTFELNGRYPVRRAPGQPEPKVTDPKADPHPGLKAPAKGAPVEEPPQPPKGGERGFLRVRGADLAQLGRRAGVEALDRLGGSVDLTFSFANDLSDGTGRVAVRGLSWGDDRLAEDLVGSLRMAHGVVQLGQVTGRFAGGSLTARGRVSARDPSRNYFVVSVERADARRLLAPVPGLGTQVTGEASVILHARVGANLGGSGRLEIARGTVAGLAVTDVTVPFEWAGMGGGTGRLTVADAAARAGEGRAKIEATYTWGLTDRLSGRVQFYDFPLKQIVGESAGSYFGPGRMNGRFDFGGERLRTADDLTGTLAVTLNQTSVRDIPILRVISPYTSPQGLLSPFQKGDARGRLARGVFRLDRLALDNGTAQLFASGTVTVAGRLDLDVTANTGQVGPNIGLLRRLGVVIPAVGPIPISVIQDVSDFLSYRTLRLHVGGTTGSPSVQVNTAALLSDEAIRFLLRRYIPFAPTQTNSIIP